MSAVAPLDGADPRYTQADLRTPNTSVPTLVGFWQRQRALLSLPGSGLTLSGHSGMAQKLVKGQWTPNFWALHSRASLTLWSSTLGHRRAWGKYWEI